jgi:hypothetical protein
MIRLLRCVGLGVVLVFCAHFCFAGEDAPKGPRVEITPSDGGLAYTAYLLGFKDGLLDLQLDSGERRHESVGGAKSVRFLPQTEAAAPAAQLSPGAKHEDAASKWSAEDERLLEDLEEREANGSLRPADVEDLRKLRVHKRWDETRREIQAAGGKVDVGAERRRLQAATKEEEAGAALRKLTWAYRHQNNTGPDLNNLLRNDVLSIGNPELRRKTFEYLRHLLGSLEARKPGRKDR